MLKGDQTTQTYVYCMVTVGFNVLALPDSVDEIWPIVFVKMAPDILKPFGPQETDTRS